MSNVSNVNIFELNQCVQCQLTMEGSILYALPIALCLQSYRTFQKALNALNVSSSDHNCQGKGNKCGIWRQVSIIMVLVWL